MTASPTAVGYALRAAGYRTVSPAAHNREGIKVSGSGLGRVLVRCDYDSTGIAYRTAEEAAADLARAGYTVTVDTNLVYVTR